MAGGEADLSQFAQGSFPAPSESEKQRNTSAMENPNSHCAERCWFAVSKKAFNSQTRSELALKALGRGRWASIKDRRVVAETPTLRPD